MTRNAVTTVRLTLLGTAAALLDPDRAHTGLLLTAGGERHYLIDCGVGIARRIVQAGVAPAEVDTVLLTHLHFDHTADIPAFTIGGWMLSRPGPYRLYGPPGHEGDGVPYVRRRRLRRGHPRARNTRCARRTSKRCVPR